MKFRPRFSVRTLAIVVTLVCAYFGAWPLTKKYGVPKPDRYGNVQIMRASSPAPLIVLQDETDVAEWIHKHNAWVDAGQGIPPLPNKPRRYYLWLFGPKIKLPYKSEWK